MFKKSIIMVTGLIIATFISGCGNNSSDDNITFTLLQTTDVHHRAAGSGASTTYSPVDGIDNSDTTDLTKGGYARLAAKISEIRNAKKNKNVLLVDSGDFLMGTIYDFTLDAETETETGTTKVPPLAFAFMEAIQYDAVTLGNHEFDFGPGPLYKFINNALGDDFDPDAPLNERISTFNVPIVASNMDATADVGITALISSGVIKDIEIKTLDNGLIVGIIGIMGADAESVAPLAAPVTFINDFETQTEALQAIVTDLKADVDILIALSHSGVSNTDPDSPAGDDITMAQKITGIDIIASGHDHATTESVIEIENGDHTTYIICAGHYGKNLAQLDVTYEKTSGITNVSLKNHAIDDSVPGDSTTDFIVKGYEEGIDAFLSASGLTIDTILGTSESDNVGKSHLAEEAGIGNLIADSLRYLTMPAVLDGLETPTLGIVANGVVRNGFTLGQEISFADLYSVLPLGMSLDEDQRGVPGYPLVRIYLTGAEIKAMCQLNAYVIAAGDADFVASLPTLYGTYSQAKEDAEELAAGLNAGSPTDLQTYNYVLSQTGTSPFNEAIQAFEAQGSGDSAACQAAAGVFTIVAAKAELAANACSPAGLQAILPMLGSDFFLHTSGVQYTHAGREGLYQVPENSVKMYPNTDIKCKTEPQPIENLTLYPCVVDIYVVLMMQQIGSSLPVSITPKDHTGTPVVTTAEILEVIIKDDGAEIKEWQALLTYLTASAETMGLGKLISDADYGADVINSGDASRVNQP